MPVGRGLGCIVSVVEPPTSVGGVNMSGSKTVLLPRFLGPMGFFAILGVYLQGTFESSVGHYWPTG